MGETNQNQGRWWRRRAVWAGVVVVVIALAIAGVIVHNVRKDRLEVGATRAGEAVMSTPVVSRTAITMVPNAKLNVRASAGQAASFDDDDTEVRAPRGGILVGVTWSSVASELPVSEHVGVASSSLVVRSEGKSVVVDRKIAPTTRERQMVVALPGGADNIVLEVRFAGRSQSVSLLTGHRTLGSFASLYRRLNWPLGQDAALSIERKEPSDPKSLFSWNANVKAQKAFRVPYLHGLGWAKERREWVVVQDVHYYLARDAAHWRSGEESVEYGVKGSPHLTITVGGRSPVKVLRAPHEAGPHDGYSAPGNGDYVFSVPNADRFTVDTVLKAALQRSSDDAQGPAKSSLRVSRSDVYPAVLDSTGDRA